jgi:hypothetical protein
MPYGGKRGKTGDEEREKRAIQEQVERAHQQTEGVVEDESKRALERQEG